MVQRLKVFALIALSICQMRHMERVFFVLEWDLKKGSEVFKYRALLFERELSDSRRKAGLCGSDTYQHCYSRALLPGLSLFIVQRNESWVNLL